MNCEQGIAMTKHAHYREKQWNAQVTAKVSNLPCRSSKYVTESYGGFGEIE